MLAIVGDLQRACEGHIAPGSDHDAVLGRTPRWVASPASTSEVAALMRVAAARDLAAVVRGVGTKLRWGAAPERFDLVVDTTRLDRLVEHAAGDLVLVTGAGRRLATLQQDVGSAGQRLGVDPARQGTIGGAVAAMASGPLRLRHGAVRDLVIGMTMVRPDGVVAHSGGKVVKNVAGYDLGKLLTGSFGTLGVVTEVALRLHPQPAGRRWVSRAVSGSAQAHSAVQALVHSQLMPSAVELDWSDEHGTVAVLVEGHPEGVAACADQAADLLGGDFQCADSPPEWWGVEPGTAATALLKVTHEIGGLAQLLEASARAESESGARARLRGSPAVGVAWLAVAAEPAQLAAFTVRVRAVARELGGSVVVLDAPDAAREGLDLWGPVAGLELMRAVKRQFDPGRRMAPGRFVGGL